MRNMELSESCTAYKESYKQFLNAEGSFFEAIKETLLMEADENHYPPDKDWCVYTEKFICPGLAEEMNETDYRRFLTRLAQYMRRTLKKIDKIHDLEVNVNYPHSNHDIEIGFEFW